MIDKPFWQTRPVTRMADGSFTVAAMLSGVERSYNVVDGDAAGLFDFGEVAAFWGSMSEGDPLKQEYVPPAADPEAERLNQIEAIKTDLLNLDLASIRPLRAIENGADTVEDHARLVEIRKRAEGLRAELRELEAAANG